MLDKKVHTGCILHYVITSINDFVFNTHTVYQLKLTEPVTYMSVRPEFHEFDKHCI
jgi:type III secretory pathway component EscU